MVPLANPPMKMYSFFFVLVLTFTCATATTVVTSRSRRTLHEPFFPQDAPVLPPVQPPAQPPSALPPSSPPSLNVPFLSTPTKTPPSDEPFFPAFPSPPPPPPSASSSVSFPANISALNLPTSPEPKHVSSKLVPVGITLAIAAVVVLSIVVFLRIKKRRYHDDSQSFTDEKPQRSYNNSVFSATANNGGGGSGGGNTSYNRIPKLNRPSQTSSEFLYLGTLVNSHGGIDATGTGGRDNRGDEDSGLQKLGSPELRPLPPLSGSCGGRSQTILQNGCYETSEVESRDEEFDEFYSPRASDGGGSGGRRAFKAAAAPGNYQPRRSIGSGSSSSYSSSSSGSPARSISLSISPPVSLSPRHSRLKSPDLVAIQTAPPPSRPPPPPPLPPHPLIIPSPDVGLSKDSFESSPRLSNSSNDQNSPLARIPPPPQPPTKLREIPIPTTPAPATRLNPPVLIKPARHVPITSHQPMISPTEMRPENQESLETNEKTTPKPKLKPLHWDKVRASSDREMVWDHLKSSSFKLNEEMIETLFIVKPPNANSNEKLTIKRQILSSTISHENQVLDPKKSQNIAITLRALSVTPDEVCDALLEGNVDALGTELLESLMKMAPTKDEEHKLQEHKDDSLVKLGQAEKFLKAILDVPFAFRRIGAMLFVSNFDSEVEYLKQSFQTLEVACEELRNSRMFLKLLEAVLKTGNRMNVGTNRGDAHAFKLDSLLKLIDVKGTDGKTTLLHFVVQEIIRIEGARVSNTTANHDESQCRKLGLQVVSSLSSSLSNVKLAASMDSEVLKGDAIRLSNGIANVIDVVRLISESNEKKFCDTMNQFLKMAQEEVFKVKAQEGVSLSLVKEITEYFHGNSAKFEAHPFRMFMVVRDFLTVLDRVCKEVGSMNDRIMLGFAQKAPVAVNQMPVFDGFHGRRQYSSSDDESSSSL